MCSLQSHGELRVSAPTGALPPLPKPSAALMQYNSALVESRRCHFIMRKTAGRQISTDLSQGRPAVPCLHEDSAAEELMHTEPAQGTGEGGSCQDAACRKGQPGLLCICPKRLRWTTSTCTAYRSVRRGGDVPSPPRGQLCPATPLHPTPSPWDPSH